MKCLPIKLARYFEYCRVRQKQEWRLAFYGIDVRSPTVNDLVSHDGIHRFAVNWLRMDKGWKADRNREENNPECGQTKSSRLKRWHNYHRAKLVFTCGGFYKII